MFSRMRLTNRFTQRRPFSFSSVPPTPPKVPLHYNAAVMLSGFVGVTCLSYSLYDIFTASQPPPPVINELFTPNCVLHRYEFSKHLTTPSPTTPSPTPTTTTTYVTNANQEAKKSKYTLVYFSAQWCPPCQRFTPLLVFFYHAMNSIKVELDPQFNQLLTIVHVSCDTSEEQLKQYASSHKIPWAFVPFEDRSRLKKMFGCWAGRDNEEADIVRYERKSQGIPTILLVRNGDGDLEKAVDVRNDISSAVESRNPFKLLKKWDHY